MSCLLVLGNVPYNSCCQRPQQLSARLARERDVVYLDPNRSFLQRWLRPPALLESSRGDNRLHVLAPPAGLPLVRTVRPFHRWNVSRTAAFLRRRAPRLDAVLATFPDQWDLVRRLPDDVPVFYDVMDDHTLFLRPWQVAAGEHRHRRLLDRAAVVLTSSRVLHDRHVGRARKVVYLGNGVPGDLVERCVQASPAVNLASLPRPRLGYLGMIASWFDVATVRALAEAFPRGSIVLVGPCGTRLGSLPNNVHVLPPIRQDEVPAALRAFDIGLIPFQVSPAIDAVSPIKMFEYLAAGLPVLASSFVEMRHHADMVSLYRDPAEAVELALGLVADLGDAQRVAERRHYALRHTWDAHAQQLHRLLETHAA